MLPAVDILLPTYNGSRYLPELLESLCGQDYDNFTVLTCDDFSNDDSREIVDSYQKKISIQRFTSGEVTVNQGAKRSFEYLLGKSTAPYIMFCDQDDIWGSEKIRHSCSAMIHIEKDLGAEIPAVVFCDLELIDENGNQNVQSFNSFHGFNRNLIYNPYYLTYRNPAPGCSMLINRVLAQVCLPFGRETIMHDWWIILHASFCGKIHCTGSANMKYRIHPSNTVGLEGDTHSGFIHYLFSFFNINRAKKLVKNHRRLTAQGKEVFRRNGKKFKSSLYFFQLIRGRLIIPLLMKSFKSLTKDSWRKP